MKYKTLWFLILVGLAVILTLGCTSTVNERGSKFDYKPGIVIDKTTKQDLVSMYGNPTETLYQGKYQVYRYLYKRDSLKHGRAIGMGLLGGLPVIGLSTLAMDNGVKNSDMQMEYELLQVTLDIKTGVVKDFFYHDSDMKGQDKSETLYLQAQPLLKQGKTKEAIALLEQAVKLNPNNHRALNTLAWTLIDLDIDVNQGVSCAERAVAIFPDSPYNIGTLGCGYFKQGDMTKAEDALTKAVKLYPVYAPTDYKSLQHDKAMLQAIKAQK